MTDVRWTYAFIDRPSPASAPFWATVTGTTLSEPRGERAEFRTLLPSDGHAPCVKFQTVAEGPGGAHIDFSVTDVPGFVARALKLGARLVADHTDWAVLASPAGQPFCAVPWQGESVRPPVHAGARLDQVCIDLPPSAYSADISFFTALLPTWTSTPSPLPEFHVLTPPPGLPTRLLLQRTTQEQPTSAHIDLATAPNLPEVRARHEQSGARLIAEFPHWTVMKDPDDGLYCLTGRDAETGTRPQS
ncbi:VOC family protein [Streptomyces roseirectus]|uniref:VOC family protein n=1 Tax=Streptomyces roseirectus TaxID=2768066 RepID=A0A7H0IBX0_9ACTN|nr:VOC family protein [Streptomyces roseirectus]QNP70286.1 VOC family protein [Streptomyces roseirectus]